MINKQKIFYEVAIALVRQGEPAKANNSCLYKSGHLKCAIGHLIPDELYSDELENASIRRIYDTELYKKEPWKKVFDYFKIEYGTGGKKEDRLFLSAIQDAHDTAHELSPHHPIWLDAFAILMRKVATEHNLSTTALDQALIERSEK